MMLYPAMSKLNERVPNRYLLVNVVSRRARQIAEAADESGEPLDEKPVTTALKEVEEGKLSAADVDISIRR
ncbi:MAG: DNA-directed RNA polymerase subunit omega [Oscillospiraceae bacterium]|nr:DNA-directed RNA polymerase subunit omega [Oscillospiraceae bacterium]